MRLCWKLAQTLKLRKSGAKRWRENLLRKAAPVWDLPGGHLMPSFPLLFLCPSTVLVWSWGSEPSQSPWLFRGGGTTLIIKSGTVFFFMGFYHTNKALSIVLAFSFTLTALESFSSRASAFRRASYFKSSTTVADNEEAIEKFCYCCYSSTASATNLNFFESLGHQFDTFI